MPEVFHNNVKRIFSQVFKVRVRTIILGLIKIKIIFTAMGLGETVKGEYI